MIGALIVGLLVLRRLPAFRLCRIMPCCALPVIGASSPMAAAMAQASWTFGLLLKSRSTVLEAPGLVGR